MKWDDAQATNRLAARKCMEAQRRREEAEKTKQAEPDPWDNWHEGDIG